MRGLRDLHTAGRFRGAPVHKGNSSQVIGSELAGSACYHRLQSPTLRTAPPGTWLLLLDNEGGAVLNPPVVLLLGPNHPLKKLIPEAK